MAIIEQETTIIPSRVVEHPAQTDEVGRVLLDAAAYIDKHGWCQGQMHDGKGRVCALGAIQAVAGFHDTRWQAEERLWDSIGFRTLQLGVGYWNDRPGRTKEEVVETFQRAAYGV